MHTRDDSRFSTPDGLPHPTPPGLESVSIRPCLFVENVAHPLFDKARRVLGMTFFHEVPRVAVLRKLLRSESAS